MARKLKKPVDADVLLAEYEAGVPLTTIGQNHGVCMAWARKVIRNHPRFKERNPLPSRIAFPIHDGHKTCLTCGEEKPLSQFGNHSKSPHGVYPHCKQCTNLANKQSRQKNQVTYAESWQARNPEWRRKYLSTKYRSLKSQVFIAYGSKCAQCGFDDIRALHVDHVNEDGASERRRRTPLQIVQGIVRARFPPSYQLLCANCNTIKACEAGTMRRTLLEERA